MKDRIMITDDMLSSLRSEIAKKMSESRHTHTLGVEKMAAKIAEVYCPEKANILRAAALLHDITKELKASEQEDIFKEYGVDISEEMRNSYPTMHSHTAALIIPELYPSFADEEIIDAVRYHTTGRGDMTLAEKIIYLSDYIDETRTYKDCVRLRYMFWSVEFESMSEEERLAHLDSIILESFDMTLTDLIERKRIISTDTAEARNSLMLKNK